MICRQNGSFIKRKKTHIYIAAGNKQHHFVRGMAQISHCFTSWISYNWDLFFHPLCVPLAFAATSYLSFVIVNIKLVFAAVVTAVISISAAMPTENNGFESVIQWIAFNKILFHFAPVAVQANAFCTETIVKRYFAIVKLHSPIYDCRPHSARARQDGGGK